MTIVQIYGDGSELDLGMPRAGCALCITSDIFVLVQPISLSDHDPDISTHSPYEHVTYIEPLLPIGICRRCYNRAPIDQHKLVAIYTGANN